MIARVRRRKVRLRGGGRRRIGKFGSGRHHAAALAQADILQFGKHAGRDRLCHDEDLTEQVRR